MKNFKKSFGEITISILLISFFIGILGSVLGSIVVTRKSIDFMGQTATKRGGCWAPCSSNKDCLPVDRDQGVRLSCDMTKGYCLPATGEKKFCQGAPEGGNCNDPCKADRHCNDHDSADPSILLHCDLSTGTCQERRPNSAKKCPGYATPTPAITGDLPEGDDFIASGGKCVARFRVAEDPVIQRISLKQINGPGTFVFGEADAVYGSSTGHKSPSGYRVWRPYNVPYTENIEVYWDPQKRHIHSNIPDGALLVIVRSGGGIDERRDIDPEVYFYYYNNIPSWLKNGEATDVIFEYYVISGLRHSRRDYKQTVRGDMCPPQNTSTPTPSPNQTLSPTLRPTSVPTLTPAPTASPTPTSIPCTADIIYILDRSSTMAVANKITQAKNAIISSSPKTGARFKLLTFDREVRNETGRDFVNYETLVSAVNSVNTGEGTAIYKALKSGFEEASGNTAIILLTDGVPSYDSDSCYYPDTIEMSSIKVLGRSAQEVRETEGVRKKRSETNNALCRERKYGYPLSEIMAFVDNNSKAKVHTIAIDPDKNAFNDEILQYIAQKTGGIHRGTNNIADAVDKAVKDACAGKGSSSTGQSQQTRTSPTEYPTRSSQNQGRSQIPQATTEVSRFPTSVPSNENSQSIYSYFPVSFNIKNSANNNISKVLLKLCSSINSFECYSFEKKFIIEAGGYFKFFENLPLREGFENDAVLNCEIVFDNGEIRECGTIPIADESGIRSDIFVNESSVESIILTYDELGDQNTDGVINAVDYAIVIVSYGSNEEQADVNGDGTVDSLDISLIVANLGREISKRY